MVDMQTYVHMKYIQLDESGYKHTPIKPSPPSRPQTYLSPSKFITTIIIITVGVCVCLRVVRTVDLVCLKKFKCTIQYCQLYAVELYAVLYSAQHISRTQSSGVTETLTL